MLSEIIYWNPIYC